MPWPELASSLSQQRAVLPDCTGIKFHGALYNQAIHDKDLAERLLAWCQSEGLSLLVTMPGALATAAHAAGLQVRCEGFADRRYVVENEQLCLAPRSQPGAVITDAQASIAHVCDIIAHGGVEIDGSVQALAVDTWCVHGDGEHSLALLQALQAWSEQCSLKSGSLLSFVAGPSFGQQHLGYAPGGAADRWSLACGNAC